MLQRLDRDGGEKMGDWTYALSACEARFGYACVGVRNEMIDGEG